MFSWLSKVFTKYRQIIMYLIFGVLTTIVNWLVYYPLYNFAGMYGTTAAVIAWVASVVFAFLTNKPFVFHSNDWSRKVVIPELLKFISCRIGSGVFELLFILLTVDLLNFDGNYMKIIVSFAVVIINYVGSKLLFPKE